LIQKTRHLDSIVAGALLVADFIDSIDPKRTLLSANMGSAFDDSGHSEGDSRRQLSDRSFQSAGALKVRIPKLRDRGIFAVIANPSTA
jgi:hypothetical protein